MPCLHPLQPVKVCFVNHFRRYELSEMKDRLTDAGFRPINIHKVLGPLEKITMSFVVYCFSLIQKIRSKKTTQTNTSGLMNIFSQFFKWANRFYLLLAWLDARIALRFLSAVLLIKAENEGCSPTNLNLFNHPFTHISVYELNAEEINLFPFALIFFKIFFLFDLV